jgi:hypothetical protein
VASLHVQLLDALKQRVISRRREIEERVGKGLEDREYQRHVGRIAETRILEEAIDTLLKGGIEAIDELEDLEEEREQTARRDRAQRRPKST